MKDFQITLLDWVQRTYADPSLFVKHQQSPITNVLLYVDDLVITGNNSSYINLFIAQLGLGFEMKNLGHLNHFLGIEVSQGPKGLFLSQSKYDKDLLNRISMLDCKPYGSPCTYKRSHGSVDTKLLPDPTVYRSITGALQYLTSTRPDLAFAVNQACQHMHSPTVAHFTALKRILRYLEGTLSHGIVFKQGPLELTAYSDADWAGDPLDRRSTIGYCVFLGPNPVSWCAKNQSTVACSLTEAEYRSVAHTAAELSWLRSHETCGS